jgi:hypothetical protein
MIPAKYKTIYGPGRTATVPIPETLTAYDEGFRDTDIELGEWACNMDDKIFFYRGRLGIEAYFDPNYYSNDVPAYDPERTYKEGEYVAFDDKIKQPLTVEVTVIPGKLTAVAFGGEGGYIYRLNNVKNTTGIFEGLEPGEYELIVTDKFETDWFVENYTVT